MRTFFDAFMDQTQLYKDYTWAQFQREYVVMSTVLYVYYIGFGANIWQSGVNNELPARVEMGDKGETEADLAPEELRQRMWWGKAAANFQSTFKAFDLYQTLSDLPDNTGGMAPFFELPDRLKS